jgi:hypothetical protein
MLQNSMVKLYFFSILPQILKYLFFLFQDCATGQVEAVPGDCQKYKVCEVTAIGSEFGAWREYTCPGGFHFEPASRACLKAIGQDCNRKLLLRQHTPAILIKAFLSNL